jgi:hypothetical protein
MRVLFGGAFAQNAPSGEESLRKKRKSAFLALNGWDVTGFDVTDEGVSVAKRNAARDLVAIAYGPFFGDRRHLHQETPPRFAAA